MQANRAKWKVLVACGARRTACALLLAGSIFASRAAEVPAVTTVGTIDLQRYAGKWYEIASFPMFFQRHCIGDTTAEYTVQADGEIAVRNRCRTEDGFDEANGTAWPVEGEANSRLKVSFFWPFRSDYWVIGLDPDYRWAVVGNPTRKYLWVLSRTPQLDQELLGRALAAARLQGYDLAPLRYTRHVPSLAR